MSVREVAREHLIPRKYLETIMTDLRRAGFVGSSRGKSGGYRLTGDPATIRIADVLQALEPGWHVSPDPLASQRPDPLPEEPVLHYLGKRVQEELALVTIADAAMRWQRERHALTYSI